MKQLTRRIHLMFNGLGAGNIGDELMFFGFLNCMHPAPGSTVEVWSSESPIVKWLPAEFICIPWTDNERCEAAALNADTVLLVGDTPVSEELGLGWPLQALSKTLGFCHNNRIPVHAVGVGVDLLRGAEAVAIFKNAYLPIRTWTVRSARCHEALCALGVPDERIFVAADLAWLYERAEDCREWASATLTGLGIDLNRPLIGVNIVNEVWGENAAVKQSIALALDRAARQLDAQIVFFCNEVREGDFFDAAAARQMMALMTEKSFFLPNEYYHPDQMIGLLSHASVTVSQRYHFTIESILAGTVPVSFARGQKMAGLLGELELPPAGTMTAANPDELFSHIEDAFARRDHWLGHLAVMRKRLAARAMENAHFYERIETDSSMPIMKEDVRKILVPRFDTLGDIVLLEGFLDALLRRFPAAEITLLVRDGYDQLAPLFPERLRWRTTRLHPYKGGVEENDYPEIERLFANISQDQWDLVLFTTYNRTWIEELLAAKLSGTTKVALGLPGNPAEWVKQALARLGLGVDLVFDKVVPADEWQHETEKYQLFWKTLFPEESALKPPMLSVPVAQTARAQEILESSGLNGEGFYICAPAGTHNVPIKAWPAERYAEVICQVYANHRLKPLLVGHENERERLEEVAQLVRERGCPIPCTWTGKDGEIPLLAALLQKGRFYVGNDTGPMHLAAALGVPTIGVFGGGTFPRFLPTGEHSTGIAGHLPCFGCYWNCLYEDGPCMRLVDAKSVINIIEAFLKNEPLSNVTILESSRDVIVRELTLSNANRYHKLNQQLAECLNRLEEERLIAEDQIKLASNKAKDDILICETSAQEHIRQLELTIMSLKTSLSWKLTAPLRWFGERLNYRKH